MSQLLALGLLTLIVLQGLFVSSASAQQTYFNVPNAELATKGEAFIQQQMGFGPEGDAELTTDFGMTEWFEFGFNLLAVPLYAPPKEEPGAREPSAVVNGQIMVSPLETVHLQVGTRQGVARGIEGHPRSSYSASGHLLARFGADDARYGNYVVGAIVGTRANVGQGSLGGGLVGFEVPVIGPKLRVVGDWVIGTNEDSVATLGLESLFDAEGRWDLAVGARLPSPRSDNDYGVIVQISWLSRGSE